MILINKTEKSTITWTCREKPINIHRISSIYFYDIFLKFGIILYEFSSDAQSCPTSCNPIDCSTSPSSRSPTPRSCSNSCPSSPWRHKTISYFVVPCSSCLQSFPASGSFPMSQLFTSVGQSIGASASASVLPMNI